MTTRDDASAEGECPARAAASEPGGALTRGAPPPGALRDLAFAFRTSAEAIDGVRELQGQLVEALKRQDRSTLVLRSTEVLNETFRDLTLVQREILDRLEEDRRSGPGRVVPMMLIGLLVVFLGATFVIVTLIEQVREEREDGREVVEAATQSALSAFHEGLEDRDGRHLEEVERLRAENTDVRRRAEKLIDRMDGEAIEKAELLEEREQIQRELDNLAEQMLRAQSEVMAKRALEDQLRATSGHLAILEPKVHALESELDTERALNSRIRKRLAALGLGLPDPEADRTQEGEGDPASALPKPPPTRRDDPRVERNGALLRKIKKRLNEILDATSTTPKGFWRIESIGGVTAEGLVEARLSFLARENRRLIQEMDVKEVRFVVDRNQRTAHMMLLDGTIRDRRGEKPVSKTGISYTVADGERFRMWSQSGLVFVRIR